MYKKIINEFQVKIEIKTLKERSKFSVSKKGLVIEIINSKKKSYIVDEDLFNQVYNRYKFLSKELKNTSSQYTDPKWPECPNRVCAVYVAAIIKHIQNKKN